MDGRTAGITEHALLYALLVREVLLELGEPAGMPVVKQMTEAYGNRRGRRMRENAERMGYGAGIDGWLLCGEWAGKPGENQSTLQVIDGETVSEVTKCARCDAWKRHDLMQYGKYYCAWIDLALRDGFDGSFALRIEKRLSEEDALCRFCWSEPADLEQAAQIKAERKESFLLPFSFHCEELKETALQVLRECLSEERAASIVAAAEQQLEAIGNPD